MGGGENGGPLIFFSRTWGALSEGGLGVFFNKSKKLSFAIFWYYV